MTQTSLRRRYQSDLLTLDAQKRTGEITRAQYDDARIRLAKEMAWRGLVLPVVDGTSTVYIVRVINPRTGMQLDAMWTAYPHRDIHSHRITSMGLYEYAIEAPCSDGWHATYGPDIQCPTCQED